MSDSQTTTMNTARLNEEKPLLVVKRAHLPQYISGLLLILLVGQYMAPVDWGAYAQLQEGFIYKQVTGYMIMAYVLFQWRVAFLRFRHKNQQAFASLKYHRWVGTIAPLLLFVHSVNIGYGFQTALLFTFLMVMVVGIFNFQAVGSRAKWYINAWTVTHISFAILSLILMVYHIYVIYWYV